ncbi:hypothetical protein NK214_11525 [Chromobacterium sp. S0633]|uniref:hypothetical protein n=1 Tax=Chromobacterium sp. S0633 TaxID=2957805 RepID=UPI0020A08BEC|nr:hypothetical protein [Chromobacterium sp. S0633]MCP1290821.1 hypothetical protein [Chromobacterium sp. S0633]
MEKGFPSLWRWAGARALLWFRARGLAALTIAAKKAGPVFQKTTTGRGSGEEEGGRLEPVQSLASKGETRRKRAKKRNVHVAHEHFELVFNAVSLKRSRH